MIKVTRWIPDTCDCVIEYQWDDSISQDQRVHTVSNVVNSCKSHKSINQQGDLFQCVLDENQTKNNTIATIMDNLPELTDTVGGSKVLKQGVVSYFFDEFRKINVVVKEITQSQRDKIDVLINKQKVKIL